MVKGVYRKMIHRLWLKLARGENVEFSNSMVKRTHAADLAEIIANLSQEEKQVETLFSLEEDLLGEVFSELARGVQEDLVKELSLQYRVKLFKNLPPDEAVDLLSLLPELEQEQLLQTLSQSQQEKFRRLSLYGKDSAGGIMTPVLIAVKSEQTVADVIAIFRRNKDEDDVFLNIFVIDDKKNLIGTLHLQTLVVSEPDKKISEIMESHFIAVNVHDDQEVVAQTVTKYNLLAVPVVNEAGTLLGRITIDDIMEVLQLEADEDAYLMAGMDAEEVHENSPVKIARLRLPWLLTCLCGSLVAGLVIEAYRGTLAQVIVLISFLPAICAMGGNSGLQTSTVTIRNLSYGLVFYKNIKEVVKREILAGITVGLTSGCILGAIAFCWLGNFYYGIIIGVSMILTIVISTFTGFFIPIFFNKVGVDPAIASGPLITTLNDATSSFTYLSIATILLRFLRLL